MAKTNLEHKIGETVVMTDTGVPRIEGKKFTVRLGSSCTGCAFSGLGHKVCPGINCTQHDRQDGHSVAYEAVEDV